jgi:hypothetical protein
MATNHVKLNYTELQTKHPEIPKDNNYLNESMQFMYFSGDAEFDGDLEIDDVDGYSGIIVAGDLRVSGMIANYCGDYGDILIVLGDVYADSLIAGGSMIDLMKGAYINKLCLTHYNHGSLSVNKLHCPVYICEHEADSIKDNSKVEYVFDTSYYAPLKENEFYLVELEEIFKDKAWSQYNDEDAIHGNSYFLDYSEYSFNFDKFITNEIITSNNIDSIINHIKAEFHKIKRQEKELLQMKVLDTGKFYRHIFRYFYQGMQYDSLGLIIDTNLKIYDGDLTIDGDLVLDKQIYAEDNISAIYINGDLKVNGTIYNTMETEGVQLYVRGKVNCRNLVISATQVYINKMLDIDDILYCTHPDKIEYSPLLKVAEIKSAALAIVEHSFDLKYSFSDGLDYKVYTVAEDKKEKHFTMEQLKNVLEEQYWSDDDNYLDESSLFRAIVDNKRVLRTDADEIISKVLDRRKRKKLESQALQDSILSMIQLIKSYLDEHSIDYQDEEYRFKIREDSVRFSVSYKSTFYSVGFGLSHLEYGKGKIKKFKKDIIFYLECYLLNKIRTIDFETKTEYHGSAFQQLKDDTWTVVQDKCNFYQKLSKRKGLQKIINTTHFDLDENSVLDLIVKLKSI